MKPNFCQVNNHGKTNYFASTGRPMSGPPIKDTQSAGTALGIEFVYVPQRSAADSLTSRCD
jgi:hypothetical protein